MAEIRTSVSSEQVGKHADLPCGYEEDFVSPVDDDLQCSICQSALRNPVLTRCGHRFCRDCLERHMSNRQECQKSACNCPVDREELVSDKDIFPDKATERKILSLCIKCSSTGCEWAGELREKEDHLLSCSFKLVSCPNSSCYVKTTRKDLDEHAATMCEWRMVSCGHCSEPHPKRFLQEHVSKCKKKPEECPNSCGEIIAREQIASHIVNQCLLTLISCPYAKMGCETKIRRKEIENHLQTATTFHLELTFTNLKSATEKLDALEKQVQELAATNSTLSRKVEEQNKTILRLKNDTSTFVWKVTGFWESLRDAKNGINEKIFSAPFFTGKQGYKQRLCIWPDGNQSKRNRYLSVYVLPMNGDYDGMLPWPFRRKITFTLIDQKVHLARRRNLEESVNVAFSKSPFADKINEFQGIARFVSHRTLNTRHYVVDNALFLQVKIDPQDFE